MDPSKALNFQTFPHQNGQPMIGTMGPNGPIAMPMHARVGSQSMVRLKIIKKDLIIL